MPTPTPTPEPNPEPSPQPDVFDCSDYKIERRIYPSNEEYVIGAEKMTIDMNAFMSDTEHRSCWKYGIEILGTGLPSNDKDAIMFDKETGELEIYSIQPLSEGDYHVRLEVVDRETEEVKDAHQIKLDFLPPVKPLPEPDTDEDENEADNDEDQEEESDNEELDEEE